MAKNKVILGIHSNIDGRNSSPDVTNTGDVIGQFTAGHAWISVITNGINVRYGLWPDEHPDTVDNGSGSDIRKNMEKNSGAANRFYLLTEKQQVKLTNILATNTSWAYTNNCSSWASEVVAQVLKVDIDADDYFGFETPRELGKSILVLESKNPTSTAKPKEFKKTKSSW